jgi:preprotein translocase SecE subunit
VARNRKRAKERRARRPQAIASPTRDPLTGAPSPLEHAAPDAELAEQAELPPLAPSTSESMRDEEEATAPQAMTRVASDADEAPPEAFEAEEDEESLAAAGPIAERRAQPGSRLAGFLQGSWRELQRVQWPDRRQVMQATGVVIGFVIIAGLWLGAADWAAKHIVDYILYGHS